MRKAHSALFALSLALVIVPEIAAAGGAFVVAPGFRGIGYPGGTAMRGPTVIHLTTATTIRSAMASMPSTVHGPTAAMVPAMCCAGYGPPGAGGKETVRVCD